MTEQLKLQDGDVFRWLWSDEAKKNDFGAFQSYHCYSRIAIVRDGKLFDTFWSDNSAKSVDPAMVDLTFLGNLKDYEKAKYANLNHYDKNDVLDLRHSNSSRDPVYLRKGARKSSATMAEHIRQQLVVAQRNQASAFRDIEQAREQLAKIQQGKLDEVWI